MSQVVYEEWLDGFVIVGEEAYFPDEYDQVAKTCPVCDRRFMVITEPNESHRVRGASRYCSDECRRGSRRRAYQRRKAA